MSLKIVNKYEEFSDGLEGVSVDYDHEGRRPAWIWVKDPAFKARFLTVATDEESEIVYKRFSGNFYYPLELKIKPLEEERFYQKFSQVYDQHVGKRNLAMADFLLKKMFQFDLSKTGKVLDLGAGTGLFSQAAAKAGYVDLTLLDRSEAMLAVAKKKSGLSRAKFVVGNALDFELGQSFGVVVSIMMFDAITDRQLPEALENIRKHLTNGGLVFIIEDRSRPAYPQFFKEKESGLFSIPGEKSFKKYYFIGSKTAELA